MSEGLAAGDLQSNYQGADGAFTYEAMINLSTLVGADGGIQNIFSRENEGAVAERSFQFRIIPGNLLHMEGIAAGAASVEIPTTGRHGFVAGEWFHVAAAYDGNGTVEFFWTRVDDAFTEANSLGTAAFASLSPTNQGETALGSQNRSSVRNELQGSIDEVRVSDIARGAGDFIFGVVESIDLSPKSFLTGVFQGDLIGTLSVPSGDPGDSFTYEIEQGVGDFAKFQIAGDQLQAGANDFTGDPDGSEYVIRISATGAPSNQTYTADFTLTATADSDRDGLPDSWELNPAWANTPADLTILSGGANDADMDLLSDTEEYLLSLSQFPTIDPTNPDSDGDDPGDESLFDGAEIDPADARGATDPTASDSEGDGLPDTVETNTGTFVDVDDTGTDPNLEDSDGDGMGDFAEVEAGDRSDGSKRLRARGAESPLDARWQCGGRVRQLRWHLGRR